MKVSNTRLFFLDFRRQPVDLVEQDDFLFAAWVHCADRVLDRVPPLAPVKRGPLRLDEVGVRIVSLKMVQLNIRTEFQISPAIALNRELVQNHQGHPVR